MTSAGKPASHRTRVVEREPRKFHLVTAEARMDGRTLPDGWIDD